MIFNFFLKVQAPESLLSFHWGRKITGLGAYWMILHTTLKILSGASSQKFFDCQNWYSRTPVFLSGSNLMVTVFPFVSPSWMQHRPVELCYSQKRNSKTDQGECPKRWAFSMCTGFILLFSIILTLQSSLLVSKSIILEEISRKASGLNEHIYTFV